MIIRCDQQSMSLDSVVAFFHIFSNQPFRSFSYCSRCYHNPAVVTVCIHLVGNGRESDPLRSPLMSCPNERGRVKALKKREQE